MKNNTLDAFTESISDSERIRKLLIDNCANCAKEEIRLNLVYVVYNFTNQTILIEYYVKDDLYPSVEMSFAGLSDFLTD